jgi:predicted metalloendopeptidase
LDEHISNKQVLYLANGTFEALINNANEAMRSILEGTYEDVYKNLAGSDQGFHTDEVDQDKQNFEKMQTFYSMCVNQSSINSLGPTPIYEDIAHIENKLFPVNDTLATLSNSNATDYITQTNVFLQRQSIQGFNYMFTYADDKNPGNYAILLDQPTLTLPAKEYYADAATVELLRSGLNNYLYKVIGEYSNVTSDSELRASESNRTGFQRWSQDKIKAAVDRFVEFETKLANVSLPA